jgi:DNA-binding PadR family transcriptional regulator
MKAFESRSGQRVSSGNFYRELRRLLVEGLVTAVPRGGPPNESRRRLAYQISDTGTLVFDDWFATAPMAPGRGPDDLAARTIFFGDGDAKSVARLLETWERDVWFYSKMLERSRAAALTAANGHEFRVLPFLLTRQVRHLTLDVEFLNEVRTAYRDWLAARDGPAAAKAVLSEKPRHRRQRKRREQPTVR